MNSRELPRATIEDEDKGDLIDLGLIYKLLRTNFLLIFVITSLVAALFMVYAFTARPVYKASAVIMIDPSNENALGERNLDPLLSRENFLIDSEIEVIKSSRVAEGASQEINLESDDDFTSTSLLPLVVNSVKGLFVLPTETSEERKKLILNQRFRSRIDVSRLGRTYAIEVSYWSYQPRRAAKIANLVAESYLQDQIERYYENNLNTNDWLASRLQSLQKDVREAEKAIEIYKRENDIVDTNNSLLSDQQLSELSSQLIIARSKTAEAQAKYKRIQEIVNTGNADSAVNDALKSSVISKLRAEYSTLVRRASELKENYGENHNAYLRVTSEIKRINQGIVAELQRIGESYRSDYEIALSSEQALQSSLDRLKGVSVFSGSSQVQLRELERQAEASKRLYNTLLETYRKSSELATLPNINARIIEPALLPLSPASPKKLLLLFAGVVIGLLLSMAIVLFRFFIDDKVWSSSDFNRLTGLPNLGMIPIFSSQTSRILHRSFLTSRQSDQSTIDLSIIRRNLFTEEKLLQESLRSIQLATRLARKRQEELSNKPLVLSLISAVPGEGKTALSLLFSVFLAGQGKRVLLLDADFRKQTLTRMLLPEPRAGLAELCFFPEKRTEILPVLDEGSKLSFMPASGSVSSDMAVNLVSQGLVEEYVEQIKPDYDYIILDLPPIYLLPDANSLNRVIDHYFFISSWGKVRRGLILEALHNNSELFQKTLGSILNHVDLSKLKSKDYGYYSAYGAYGNAIEY